jgi:ABC-type nickel/cobalt efflux system permease component RcnA
VRRLVALLALAVALAAPAAAAAHPLGNFTINRYSRIDLSGDHLYVVYVLDMAEIPTFQARQEGIDATSYARRIAAAVTLRVDGRPRTLRPAGQALAFPPGAGGLRTTRLEVLLEGPHLQKDSLVVYQDNNYKNRIGWSEIVVRAGHGAGVVSSTAPHRSRSDELRAYPKDLLRSPLDVRSADVRFRPGPAPGPPPSLSHGPTLRAPDRVADSGFARLVAHDRLDLPVILGSLAAALFWGAAHALSPGHGKTIVTAYLVGRRGTPLDAALLGLVVTVTHTVGVFALGLVTLALSQFLVPDQLYPWLNLTAGLLVVGVGMAVLRLRIRGWLSARMHARAHAREGAGHHGHHDHHHHHQVPEPGTGLRGLVAVGVSGGLLPCPSALVVLLAAISLHRVAFGLALILAFSAGLALAITGVGLAAVLAKRAFARARVDGALLRALPALSALIILLAGVAMTAQALPKVR